MKNLADLTDFAPTNGFTGAKNGSGLLAPAGDGITLFTNFLSSAIGLITVIGIIWFVFIIILGAIGIISSGGDKNSLESAKKKISTGVIGLVILVIAMFAIDLLGYLLGFGSGNTGILNLQNLFNSLTGGGTLGGGPATRTTP